MPPLPDAWLAVAALCRKEVRYEHSHLGHRGPFLGFMKSLFHGLDLKPLLRSAPFSWRGFVEALLVMFLWAFLAGRFFGWLRLRLGA